MSKKNNRNILGSRIRSARPIPMREKNGIRLLCPFCSDHHPLMPDQESSCGTRIEVTAVQEVFPARFVHKERMTCVKCNQGSGEMVRYGSGFVHLAECSPGTNLLHDVPHNDRLAQFVSGLPKFARSALEKVSGRTVEKVFELEPDGNRNGKVVAHFFRNLKAHGEQKSA